MLNLFNTLFKTLFELEIEAFNITVVVEDQTGLRIATAAPYTYFYLSVLRALQGP